MGANRDGAKQQKKRESKRSQDSSIYHGQQTGDPFTASNLSIANYRLDTSIYHWRTFLTENSLTYRHILTLHHQTRAVLRQAN